MSADQCGCAVVADPRDRELYGAAQAERLARIRHEAMHLKWAVSHARRTRQKPLEFRLFTAGLDNLLDALSYADFVARGGAYNPERRPAVEARALECMRAVLDVLSAGSPWGTNPEVPHPLLGAIAARSSTHCWWRHTEAARSRVLANASTENIREELRRRGLSDREIDATIDAARARLRSSAPVQPRPSVAKVVDLAAYRARNATGGEEP